MPNMVKFQVANISAGNLGKVALQLPHAAQLSTALSSGAKLTTLSESYKLPQLGDVTLTAHGVEGFEGHVLQNVNNVLGTVDVDGIVEAE